MMTILIVYLVCTALIGIGYSNRIDDPYSKYLDKDKTEALNEELEGEYVGMGGEITFRRNGEIYISKVYENSLFICGNLFNGGRD